MAVDALLDAVANELADDPLATAPTATGASGAKRPTASPAPPPRPNPSRPRLPHVCRAATLPSGACVTRITPSIETCVSLTRRAQRPEVLRRPVDVRVARDEHVGRCLSHYDSPSGPAREDLNKAQVFCRKFQANRRRPRVAHPLRMNRHPELLRPLEAGTTGTPGLARRAQRNPRSGGRTSTSPWGATSEYLPSRSGTQRAHHRPSLTGRATNRPGCLSGRHRMTGSDGAPELPGE
jgi:hypothetical protein